jgi:hypothetical protein
LSARLTQRRRAARSDIRSNALSGTIPASLSSLTNLQWLCDRAHGARRQRAPHATPPRRSQLRVQQRPLRRHPQWRESAV